MIHQKIKTMKKFNLFKALLIFIVNFSVLAFAPNSQNQFEVKVVGEGEPMLLIPGLGCSGEVWDETVDKYSKDYECHIFTLAGFDTVSATDEPSLSKAKEALTDYIQENKLESADIMGHSLGGFMALWLASENPNFFDDIVVVDALPYLAALFNPSATPENVPFDGEMMYQMIAKAPDEMYANQQRYTLRSMITDSTYVEKALQWSLNSDRKTVMYAMETMMKTDLRQAIANIDNEVLVLGACDEPAMQTVYPNVTKEDVIEQYSLQYTNLKNVELKFPEQARHFLMYDATDWFFKEIDAFLK